MAQTDFEVFQERLYVCQTKASEFSIGVTSDDLRKERHRQENLVKQIRVIEKEFRESNSDYVGGLKDADELVNSLQANIAALKYLSRVSSLETTLSATADIVTRRAIQSSDAKLNDSIVFEEQYASQNVKENWKYVSRLAELIPLHTKNAGDYHQFNHDVNEINAILDKRWRTVANHVETFNPYGNLKEGIQLANDLKEHQAYFLHLSTRVLELQKQSNCIVPIHLRQQMSSGASIGSGYLRDQALRGRAMCNIPCQQFSIREGDELLVLPVRREDEVLSSSSQVPGGRHMSSASTLPLAGGSLGGLWFVRTLTGEEAYVPSVCVYLNGPDIASMQAAIELKRKLVSVWESTVKRFRTSLTSYYVRLLRQITKDPLLKVPNRDTQDKLQLFMRDVENLLLKDNPDVWSAKLKKVLTKMQSKLQHGQDHPDAKLLRQTDVIQMHTPLLSYKDNLDNMLSLQRSHNFDEDYRQLQERYAQERKRQEEDFARQDRLHQDMMSDLGKLTYRIDAFSRGPTPPRRSRRSSEGSEGSLELIPMELDASHHFRKATGSGYYSDSDSDRVSPVAGGRGGKRRYQARQKSDAAYGRSVESLITVRRQDSQTQIGVRSGQFMMQHDEAVSPIIFRGPQMPVPPPQPIVPKADAQTYIGYPRQESEDRSSVNSDLYRAARRSQTQVDMRPRQVSANTQITSLYDKKRLAEGYNVQVQAQAGPIRENVMTQFGTMKRPTSLVGTQVEPLPSKATQTLERSQIHSITQWGRIQADSRAQTQSLEMTSRSLEGLDELVQVPDRRQRVDLMTQFNPYISDSMAQMGPYPPDHVDQTDLATQIGHLITDSTTQDTVSSSSQRTIGYDVQTQIGQCFSDSLTQMESNTDTGFSSLKRKPRLVGAITQISSRSADSYTQRSEGTEEVFSQMDGATSISGSGFTDEDEEDELYELMDTIKRRAWVDTLRQRLTALVERNDTTVQTAEKDPVLVTSAVESPHQLTNRGSQYLNFRDEKLSQTQQIPKELYDAVCFVGVRSQDSVMQAETNQEVLMTAVERHKDLVDSGTQTVYVRGRGKKMQIGGEGWGMLTDAMCQINCFSQEDGVQQKEEIEELEKPRKEIPAAAEPSLKAELTTKKTQAGRGGLESILIYDLATQTIVRTQTTTSQTQLRGLEEKHAEVFMVQDSQGIQHIGDLLVIDEDLASPMQYTTNKLDSFTEMDKDGRQVLHLSLVSPVTMRGKLIQTGMPQLGTLRDANVQITAKASSMEIAAAESRGPMETISQEQQYAASQFHALMSCDDVSMTNVEISTDFKGVTTAKKVQVNAAMPKLDLACQIQPKLEVSSTETTGKQMLEKAAAVDYRSKSARVEALLAEERMDVMCQVTPVFSAHGVATDAWILPETHAVHTTGELINRYVGDVTVQGLHQSLQIGESEEMLKMKEIRVESQTPGNVKMLDEASASYVEQKQRRIQTGQTFVAMEKLDVCCQIGSIPPDMKMKRAQADLTKGMSDLAFQFSPTEKRTDNRGIAYLQETSDHNTQTEVEEQAVKKTVITSREVPALLQAEMEKVTRAVMTNMASNVIDLEVWSEQVQTDSGVSGRIRMTRHHGIQSSSSPIHMDLSTQAGVRREQGATMTTMPGTTSSAAIEFSWSVPQIHTDMSTVPVPLTDAQCQVSRQTYHIQNGTEAMPMHHKRIATIILPEVVDASCQRGTRLLDTSEQTAPLPREVITAQVAPVEKREWRDVFVHHETEPTRMFTQTQRPVELVDLQCQVSRQSHEVQSGTEILSMEHKRIATIILPQVFDASCQRGTRLADAGEQTTDLTKELVRVEVAPIDKRESHDTFAYHETTPTRTLTQTERSMEHKRIAANIPPESFDASCQRYTRHTDAGEQTAAVEVEPVDKRESYDTFAYHETGPTRSFTQTERSMEHKRIAANIPPESFDASCQRYTRHTDAGEQTAAVEVEPVDKRESYDTFAYHETGPTRSFTQTERSMEHKRIATSILPDVFDASCQRGTRQADAGEQTAALTKELVRTEVAPIDKREWRDSFVYHETEPSKMFTQTERPKEMVDLQCQVSRQSHEVQSGTEVISMEHKRVATSIPPEVFDASCQRYTRLTDAGEQTAAVEVEPVDKRESYDAFAYHETGPTRSFTQTERSMEHKRIATSILPGVFDASCQRGTRQADAGEQTTALYREVMPVEVSFRDKREFRDVYVYHETSPARIFTQTEHGMKPDKVVSEMVDLQCQVSRQSYHIESGTDVTVMHHKRVATSILPEVLDASCQRGTRLMDAGEQTVSLATEYVVPVVVAPVSRETREPREMRDVLVYHETAPTRIFTQTDRLMEHGRVISQMVDLQCQIHPVMRSTLVDCVADEEAPIVVLTEQISKVPMEVKSKRCQFASLQNDLACQVGTLAKSVPTGSQEKPGLVVDMECQSHPITMEFSLVHGEEIPEEEVRIVHPQALLIKDQPPMLVSRKSKICQFGNEHNDLSCQVGVVARDIALEPISGSEKGVLPREKQWTPIQCDSYSQTEKKKEPKEKTPTASVDRRDLSCQIGILSSDAVSATVSPDATLIAEVKPVHSFSIDKRMQYQMPPSSRDLASQVGVLTHDAAIMKDFPGLESMSQVGPVQKDVSTMIAQRMPEIESATFDRPHYRPQVVDLSCQIQTNSRDAEAYFESERESVRVYEVSKTSRLRDDAISLYNEETQTEKYRQDDREYVVTAEMEAKRMQYRSYTDNRDLACQIGWVQQEAMVDHATELTRPERDRRVDALNVACWDEEVQTEEHSPVATLSRGMQVTFAEHKPLFDRAVEVVGPMVERPDYSYVSREGMDLACQIQWITKDTALDPMAMPQHSKRLQYTRSGDERDVECQYEVQLSPERRPRPTVSTLMFSTESIQEVEEVQRISSQQREETSMIQKTTIRQRAPIVDRLCFNTEIFADAMEQTRPIGLMKHESSKRIQTILEVAKASAECQIITRDIGLPELTFTKGHPVTKRMQAGEPAREMIDCMCQIAYRTDTQEAQFESSVEQFERASLYHESIQTEDVEVEHHELVREPRRVSLVSRAVQYEKEAKVSKVAALEREAVNVSHKRLQARMRPEDMNAMCQSGIVTASALVGPSVTELVGEEREVFQRLVENVPLVRSTSVYEAICQASVLTHTVLVGPSTPLGQEQEHLLVHDERILYDAVVQTEERPHEPVRSVDLHHKRLQAMIRPGDLNAMCQSSILTDTVQVGPSTRLVEEQEDTIVIGDVHSMFEVECQTEGQSPQETPKMQRVTGMENLTENVPVRNKRLQAMFRPEDMNAICQSGIITNTVQVGPTTPVVSTDLDYALISDTQSMFEAECQTETKLPMQHSFSSQTDIQPEMPIGVVTVTGVEHIPEVKVHHKRLQAAIHPEDLNVMCQSSVITASVQVATSPQVDLVPALVQDTRSVYDMDCQTEAEDAPHILIPRSASVEPASLRNKKLQVTMLPQVSSVLCQFGTVHDEVSTSPEKAITVERLENVSLYDEECQVEREVDATETLVKKTPVLTTSNDTQTDVDKKIRDNWLENAEDFDDLLDQRRGNQSRKGREGRMKSTSSSSASEEDFVKEDKDPYGIKGVMAREKRIPSQMVDAGIYFVDDGSKHSKRLQALVNPSEIDVMCSIFTVNNEVGVQWESEETPSLYDEECQVEREVDATDAPAKKAIVITATNNTQTDAEKKVQDNWLENVEDFDDLLDKRQGDRSRKGREGRKKSDSSESGSEDDLMKAGKDPNSRKGVMPREKRSLFEMVDAGIYFTEESSKHTKRLQAQVNASEVDAMCSIVTLNNDVGVQWEEDEGFLKVEEEVEKEVVLVMEKTAQRRSCVESFTYFDHEVKEAQCQIMSLGEDRTTFTSERRLVNESVPALGSIFVDTYCESQSDAKPQITGVEVELFDEACGTSLLEFATHDRLVVEEASVELRDSQCQVIPECYDEMTEMEMEPPIDRVDYHEIATERRQTESTQRTLVDEYNEDRSYTFAKKTQFEQGRPSCQDFQSQVNFSALSTPQAVAVEVDMYEEACQTSVAGLEETSVSWPGRVRVSLVASFSDYDSLPHRPVVDTGHDPIAVPSTDEPDFHVKRVTLYEESSQTEEVRVIPRSNLLVDCHSEAKSKEAPLRPQLTNVEIQTLVATRNVKLQKGHPSGATPTQVSQLSSETLVAQMDVEVQFYQADFDSIYDEFITTTSHSEHHDRCDAETLTDDVDLELLLWKVSLEKQRELYESHGTQTEAPDVQLEKPIQKASKRVLLDMEINSGKFRDLEQGIQTTSATLVNEDVDFHVKQDQHSVQFDSPVEKQIVEREKAPSRHVAVEGVTVEMTDRHGAAQSYDTREHPSQTEAERPRHLVDEGVAAVSLEFVDEASQFTQILEPTMVIDEIVELREHKVLETQRAEVLKESRNVSSQSQSILLTDRESRHAEPLKDSAACTDEIKTFGKKLQVSAAIVEQGQQYDTDIEEKPRQVPVVNAAHQVNLYEQLKSTSVQYLTSEHDKGQQHETITDVKPLKVAMIDRESRHAEPLLDTESNTDVVKTSGKKLQVSAINSEQAAQFDSRSMVELVGETVQYDAPEGEDKSVQFDSEPLEEEIRVTLPPLELHREVIVRDDAECQVVVSTKGKKLQAHIYGEDVGVEAISEEYPTVRPLPERPVTDLYSEYAEVVKNKKLMVAASQENFFTQTQSVSLLSTSVDCKGPIKCNVSSGPESVEEWDSAVQYSSEMRDTYSESLDMLSTDSGSTLRPTIVDRLTLPVTPRETTEESGIQTMRGTYVDEYTDCSTTDRSMTSQTEVLLSRHVGVDVLGFVKTTVDSAVSFTEPEKVETVVESHGVMTAPMDVETLLVLLRRHPGYYEVMQETGVQAHNLVPLQDDWHEVRYDSTDSMVETTQPEAPRLKERSVQCEHRVTLLDAEDQSEVSCVSKELQYGGSEKTHDVSAQTSTKVEDKAEQGSTLLAQKTKECGTEVVRLKDEVSTSPSIHTKDQYAEHETKAPVKPTTVTTAMQHSLSLVTIPVQVSMAVRTMEDMSQTPHVNVVDAANENVVEEVRRHKDQLAVSPPTHALLDVSIQARTKSELVDCESSQDKQSKRNIGIQKGFPRLDDAMTSCYIQTDHWAGLIHESAQTGPLTMQDEMVVVEVRSFDNETQCEEQQRIAPKSQSRAEQISPQMSHFGFTHTEAPPALVSKYADYFVSATSAGTQSFEEKSPQRQIATATEERAFEDSFSFGVSEDWELEVEDQFTSKSAKKQERGQQRRHEDVERSDETVQTMWVNLRDEHFSYAPKTMSQGNQQDVEVTRKEVQDAWHLTTMKCVDVSTMSMGAEIRETTSSLSTAHTDEGSQCASRVLRDEQVYDVVDTRSQGQQQTQEEAVVETKAIANQFTVKTEERGVETVPLPVEEEWVVSTVAPQKSSALQFATPVLLEDLHTTGGPTYTAVAIQKEEEKHSVACESIPELLEEWYITKKAARAQQKVRPTFHEEGVEACIAHTMSTTECAEEISTSHVAVSTQAVSIRETDNNFELRMKTVSVESGKRILVDSRSTVDQPAEDIGTMSHVEMLLADAQTSLQFSTRNALVGSEVAEMTHSYSFLEEAALHNKLVGTEARRMTEESANTEARVLREFRGSYVMETMTSSCQGESRNFVDSACEPIEELRPKQRDAELSVLIVPQLRELHAGFDVEQRSQATEERVSHTDKMNTTDDVVVSNRAVETGGALLENSYSFFTQETHGVAVDALARPNIESRLAIYEMHTVDTGSEAVGKVKVQNKATEFHYRPAMRDNLSERAGKDFMTTMTVQTGDDIMDEFVAELMLKVKEKTFARMRDAETLTSAVATRHQASETVVERIAIDTIVCGTMQTADSGDQKNLPLGTPVSIQTSEARILSATVQGESAVKVNQGVNSLRELEEEWVAKKVALQTSARLESMTSQLTQTQAIGTQDSEAQIGWNLKPREVQTVAMPTVDTVVFQEAKGVSLHSQTTRTGIEDVATETPRHLLQDFIEEKVAHRLESAVKETASKSIATTVDVMDSGVSVGFYPEIVDNLVDGSKVRSLQESVGLNTDEEIWEAYFEVKLDEWRRLVPRRDQGIQSPAPALKDQRAEFERASSESKSVQSQDKQTTKEAMCEISQLNEHRSSQTTKVAYLDRIEEGGDLKAKCKEEQTQSLIQLCVDATHSRVLEHLDSQTQLGLDTIDEIIQCSLTAPPPALEEMFAYYATAQQAVGLQTVEETMPVTMDASMFVASVQGDAASQTEAPVVRSHENFVCSTFITTSQSSQMDLATTQLISRDASYRLSCADNRTQYEVVPVVSREAQHDSEEDFVDARSRKRQETAQRRGVEEEIVSNLQCFSVPTRDVSSNTTAEDLEELWQERIRQRAVRLTSRSAQADSFSLLEEQRVTIRQQEATSSRFEEKISVPTTSTALQTERETVNDKWHSWVLHEFDAGCDATVTLVDRGMLTEAAGDQLLRNRDTQTQQKSVYDEAVQHIPLVHSEYLQVEQEEEVDESFSLGTQRTTQRAGATRRIVSYTTDVAEISTQTEAEFMERGEEDEREGGKTVSLTTHYKEIRHHYVGSQQSPTGSPRGVLMVHSDSQTMSNLVDHKVESLSLEELDKTGTASKKETVDAYIQATNHQHLLDFLVKQIGVERMQISFRDYLKLDEVDVQTDLASTVETRTQYPSTQRDEAVATLDASLIWSREMEEVVSEEVAPFSMQMSSLQVTSPTSFSRTPRPGSVASSTGRSSAPVLASKRPPHKHKRVQRGSSAMSLCEVGLDPIFQWQPSAEEIHISVIETLSEEATYRRRDVSGLQRTEEVEQRFVFEASEDPVPYMGDVAPVRVHHHANESVQTDFCGPVVYVGEKFRRLQVSDPVQWAPGDPVYVSVSHGLRLREMSLEWVYHQGKDICPEKAIYHNYLSTRYFDAETEQYITLQEALRRNLVKKATDDYDDKLLAWDVKQDACYEILEVLKDEATQEFVSTPVALEEGLLNLHEGIYVNGDKMVDLREAIRQGLLRVRSEDVSRLAPSLPTITIDMPFLGGRTSPTSLSSSSSSSSSSSHS